MVIEDIARLKEVNAQIGAKLAIIAVPASAAQTVADMLVEAGITGILNFAPTVLKVRPYVFVRNVSFLQELAVLSYHRSRRDRNRSTHRRTSRLCNMTIWCWAVALRG